VNHPSAEEWMGYLYDELAPERQRELHAHLARCGDCGRQWHQWRASRLALDDWKLPARRPRILATPPATVLKWAAAAAVVFIAGFAIARQSFKAAGEVAELKTAVSRLTQKIENDRAAINEQSVRLLTEYAKLDDQHRAEDRQAVGLALREVDSRLLKLRTELETVAVNTESGFQQTKAGLTTLASYTVADRGGAADFTKPQGKNQ